MDNCFILRQKQRGAFVSQPDSQMHFLFMKDGHCLQITIGNGGWFGVQIQWIREPKQNSWHSRHFLILWRCCQGMKHPSNPVQSQSIHQSARGIKESSNAVDDVVSSQSDLLRMLSLDAHHRILTGWNFENGKYKVVGIGLLNALK